MLVLQLVTLVYEFDDAATCTQTRVSGIYVFDMQEYRVVGGCLPHGPELN
jgi:hypothetical protein